MPRNINRVPGKTIGKIVLAMQVNKFNDVLLEFCTCFEAISSSLKNGYLCLKILFKKSYLGNYRGVTHTTHTTHTLNLFFKE